MEKLELNYDYTSNHYNELIYFVTHDNISGHDLVSVTKKKVKTMIQLKIYITVHRIQSYRLIIIVHIWY